MLNRKNIRWPYDYTPPYWLPNWADVNQYDFDFNELQQLDVYDGVIFPAHNNLYFAWQFLRRNPEYQKIYDEYVEAYKQIFEVEVSEKDDEWEAVLRRFLQINHRICENFALTSIYVDNFELPNPSESLYYLPPVNIDRDIVFMGFSKLTTQRTITFDLTLPLNPQLKQAKELLLEMQKNNSGKKIHRKHNSFEKDILTRYLRILDFDAINANKVIKTPDSELCKVIYSTDKNVLKYSNDNRGQSKNPRIPAREALKKNRSEAYDLLYSSWKLLLS